MIAFLRALNDEVVRRLAALLPATAAPSTSAVATQLVSLKLMRRSDLSVVAVKVVRRRSVAASLALTRPLDAASRARTRFAAMRTLTLAVR